MRTDSLTIFALALGFAACTGPDTMAPATMLAVPTGVSAYPSDEMVSLSWTIVPGATSYNIYWSQDPRVSASTGIKIAGVADPYAQNGLANGTTYYFVVTAMNSQQESKASAVVAAVPFLVPIVLSTTAPPSGAVGMSYDRISGFSHYLCTYSSGCRPCSATVVCGGVPQCGVIRPPCVETFLKHTGGWTVTAQGGRSPYTWSVSGLPAGLVMNLGGLDLPNGIRIGGTPTTAGSYVVTITLHDSGNTRQTASVTDTIVITP